MGNIFKPTFGEYMCVCLFLCILLQKDVAKCQVSHCTHRLYIVQCPFGPMVWWPFLLTQPVHPIILLFLDITFECINTIPNILYDENCWISGGHIISSEDWKRESDTECEKLIVRLCVIMNISVVEFISTHFSMLQWCNSVNDAGWICFFNMSVLICYCWCSHKTTFRIHFISSEPTSAPSFWKIKKL